jgi:hypothetical protein
MKICINCEEPKLKGYMRDPYSGKEEGEFWCDECYERASRHEYRERYTPRRRKGRKVGKSNDAD